MISLIVLATGVLFAACAPPDGPYTIEVRTADNMPWSGIYLINSLDGKVTEHSIEHVGPHRFTVRGKSVVVRFRKGDVEGAFTVEIFKNGVSVANSTTWAKNGEVVAVGN